MEQQYVVTLQQEFAAGIREVIQYAGEVTLLVKTDALFGILKILKEKFGYNYLTDIVATDRYTDEERFEVGYNIVNLNENKRIRIKCRVEEEDPTVDSVVDIWPSANWFEREQYDMLGIKFKNHPDLRRMYMPEDFEYFPLRKEFPLIGIPGSIEMPEKDPPKTYK